MLSGHGGFVTSVTIAADGRKAITTSGDMLGIVWDLQTGTALETLQGHSAVVTAAVMTRKSRHASCRQAFVLRLETRASADGNIASARPWQPAFRQQLVGVHSSPSCKGNIES